MPRFVLVGIVCAAAAACAPTTAPPTSPSPWFVDVTDEVGLAFTHESGATGGLHLPEIMSAGAALLDYDGDGDLDVYLTSGNRSLDREPASPAPTNRLFRQDSDGSFTDVTRDSGLEEDGYGMGPAVGDIDNDGDLDLYVVHYGADRLFVNLGDGSFTDATETAGIAVDGFGSSAVFCDYDGDGFLDLYVARYVRYDPRRECHDSAGRRDYCTPIGYEPEADVLLHNNGDGTFADVSEQAGLSQRPAAGLGVACDDFDGDGLPDFYVANDKYANHLWLNRGDGTFRDQAMVRGAAYNLEGRTEAGMGVVAADLDNDAAIDLYVTHIETESNTLYRNMGDGIFEDVTAAFGLVEPTVPFTGFGVVALDVEADGDLDLFVANGRVLRRAAATSAAAGAGDWRDGYGEGNLFLLREAARFDSREELAPSFTDPRTVSRALATGDLDGDGDLDLLVGNAQARARIFRNEAPREGHWLLVRAIDPRLKRDAIGARLSVTAGERQFTGTVSRGSSYLSSHDARVHFGLGAVRGIDRIDVRWPDGLEERFPNIPLDRAITLVRGEGEAPS